MDKNLITKIVNKEDLTKDELIEFDVYFKETIHPIMSNVLMPVVKVLHPIIEILSKETIKKYITCENEMKAEKKLNDLTQFLKKELKEWKNVDKYNEEANSMYRTYNEILEMIKND